MKHNKLQIMKHNSW